jgi:hypothetical protein
MIKNCHHYVIGNLKNTKGFRNSSNYNGSVSNSKNFGVYFIKISEVIAEIQRFVHSGGGGGGTICNKIFFN